MAVVNPNGNLKFWFEGRPFRGIKNSSFGASDLRFWFEGTQYSEFIPGANAQAKFFMVF